MLPTSRDYSEHDKLVDMLGLVKFISQERSLEEEKDDRKKIAEKHCDFGIKYLDDMLGGIQRNDFILVGGKSGQGKSSLASIITQHNINQGKRVFYLALEAERHELVRRQKFRMLAKRYYALSGRKKHLNFIDWYNFRQENLVEYHEAEVDAEIKKTGQLLNVLYSDKELKFFDIRKQIMAVKNFADLFIIDHLHYIGFDSESDRFGENRQMKDLVHQLHDLSLYIGVPVIAIAHMRKSNKIMKCLVPDMEDFHGTSELFKVATKVITFAVGKQPTKGKTFLNPTYFRIDKCRLSGMATKYLGKVNYNFRLEDYESEYDLGRLSQDEAKFEILEKEEYPSRLKEILNPNQGAQDE
jgi:archaellum biogenesis ATPase FlaH